MGFLDGLEAWRGSGITLGVPCVKSGSCMNQGYISVVYNELTWNEFLDEDRQYPSYPSAWCDVVADWFLCVAPTISSTQEISILGHYLWLTTFIVGRPEGTLMWLERLCLVSLCLWLRLCLPTLPLPCWLLSIYYMYVDPSSSSSSIICPFSLPPHASQLTNCLLSYHIFHRA
jgi:hypothetical protein